MAFRFRLQKVLEHRQRLENEAKRDYHIAQAKTAEALKELEDLYVAIDIARNRAQVMQSSQTGLPDARLTPTLQLVDVFINGQKTRIELQRAKIREFKGEEERYQDLLIQAARERKTLEKLRERHLQSYREEYDRREQAEADDLSVMRYRRGEGP